LKLVSNAIPQIRAQVTPACEDGEGKKKRRKKK
jgi:hypothetical protein